MKKCFKMRRNLKKLKAESEKLEEEFSGSIEETKPLTDADKEWLKKALLDTGPKVPVTIRLKKWQIERAKQLAKERHLRGYQTLISEILTESLLSV